jgi:hypothetical protein
MSKLISIRSITRWIQNGDVEFVVNGKELMHQKYLDLFLCQNGSIDTAASLNSSCYGHQRLYKEETVGQSVFPFILIPPETRYIHKSKLQRALNRAIQASCPPVEALHNGGSYSSFKFVVLQRESNRHVLNLKEMVEVLNATYPVVEFLHVGEFFLQSLSLCETAKLFGNARGLIGGHGAGLTNMLFLPPNSTVIQFISPYQGGAEYYRNLTDSLDINHLEMMSVTRMALQRKTNSNSEDTILDICNAERLLRPYFRSLGLTPTNNSTLLDQFCAENSTSSTSSDTGASQ